MDFPFEGSNEDIQAKMEKIIRPIAPNATCEVRDDLKRVIFGTARKDGKRRKLVSSLHNLDRSRLETIARSLAADDY